MCNVCLGTSVLPNLIMPILQNSKLLSRIGAGFGSQTKSQLKRKQLSISIDFIFSLSFCRSISLSFWWPDQVPYKITVWTATISKINYLLRVEPSVEPGVRLGAEYPCRIYTFISFCFAFYCLLFSAFVNICSYISFSTSHFLTF